MSKKLQMVKYEERQESVGWLRLSVWNPGDLRTIALMKAPGWVNRLINRLFPEETPEYTSSKDGNADE